MSIPVPTRPSGYRLGSGEAQIQIDAFIDLECPFSKKAWPTMLALTNQEPNDRLAITTHPMVLCDHRQSWDLTKAVTAIAGDDASTAWKFISYLFKRQEEYHGAAFDDKTRQDLLTWIRQCLGEFDATAVPDAILQEIADEGSELASRAKVSVRHSISRGVWSTPTFFINGSVVPQLESSSTLDEWQDFLQSL
ncbi:MAG: DsbA family protein [Leptolyngbyaceae cyanobacterium]